MQLVVTTITPHSSLALWDTLPTPIIGLSPMDGVSDAAMRYITALHGKPAVMYTEFTAVEGLRAGADRLLEDFYYHPIERPIIAQLFGADPEAFFESAVICAALGFDGIDINMGCPAKSVTHRGAGAALIRDPERARAMIHTTRQGAAAWAEGISLEEAGVHPRLIPLIEQRIAYLKELEPTFIERRHIPVSVKTRIGYDTPIAAEWMNELVQARPDIVSLHGRTLKQLYAGQADWEEIAKGAQVVHSEGIRILGNGDVHSIEDGLSKMREANTDGFLIGRAAIGNPWLFIGHQPTLEERKAITLEHARYLNHIFPGKGFVRIRRHLLEYTKNFVGAREVRMQLASITTLADVERIIAELPAI